MKNKLKKIAVILLALAILPAFALISAAGAEPGAAREPYELISGDITTIENISYAAQSDKLGPPLKEGRYEKWIDRIDCTGAEYIIDLYNWLAENSDGDGVEDALIDYTEIPESGQNISKGQTGAYGQMGTNGEYFVYCLDISMILSSNPQTDLTEVQANSQKVMYNAIAAVDAFERDHPEVFWLNGSCSFTYRAWYDGSEYSQTFYLIIKSSAADAQSDMRLEDYRDPDVIKATAAEIDEAVSKILEDMPLTDAVGKIKYFNDWLTKNNCYNENIDADNISGSLAKPDAWECTSALLGKTGLYAPVCEGYARAFKVLCGKAGIPCVLESGSAFSSLTEYNSYKLTGNGGTPHMWNSVKADGSWYGVDVTWNDPVANGVNSKVSGYENENYLLVGSDTNIKGMNFNQSHVMENVCRENCVGFSNSPEMSKSAYVQGSACAHEFEKETLKCKLCGKTAKFELARGETVYYYVEIGEAIRNITLAGADASDITLKLLYDEGSAQSPVSLDITASFTLDLGGKTFYGELNIFSGADVILKDSKLGGKIINAEDYSVKVSGGEFTLSGAVYGVLFESGTLTLAENAEVCGSGIYIPSTNKNAFTVSGAPRAKISVTKDGTGAVAVPDEGVLLNPDWFNAGESGKVFVFGEDGKSLVLKLLLPEVTLEAEKVTYDGKSHKPSLSLGSLTENKDYTVSYKRGDADAADLTRAGVITVTVKGTGDYTGEAVLTFTIEKAVPTAENFEMVSASAVYSGKPIDPTVRSNVVARAYVSYKLGGADALPVNAGKYEVYISVEESENYLAAEDILIGDFEIIAREITVIAKDQTVIQNSKPDVNRFIIDGEGLVGGHSAEIAFAGADTSKIGEIKLAVGSVTIKDTNGKDVTQNYRISMTDGKLTVKAHEHSWVYSANGSIIMASCKGEGSCPDDNMNSLAIKPPVNAIYNNGAHTATFEGALAGVDLSEIAILYKDASGKDVEAPVSAGKYTVLVTAGGVTATLEYRIEYLSVNESAVQQKEKGRVLLIAPEGYKISRELRGAYTVWSDSLEFSKGESEAKYYLMNAEGQITDAKTVSINKEGASVITIIAVSAAAVTAVAVVAAVIIKKRKNS